MGLRNDIWQGDCGYWQDLFIRENLLPLGHAAWQGFITEGRGMVACDVAAIATRFVDYNSDIVEHTVRFVPLLDVSAYLQTLHLKTTVIERLLDTVQTYDPVREILLLIDEDGQADINLLRNLKVAPVDCYQQVQRCWVEFQLDQSPGDLYEQKY